MAREAICTRDKDGLNSENVGVKDVTDSTRDLSSHVYVESWRDRVRVPHQQIRYKRIWGSTRRGPIARRGVRPPRSAPDENHDKEQMSCASVASEGGCMCHTELKFVGLFLR